MIKTHCRWFCYFRYGNFYVQVGFRSGRPSTEEVDEIVAEVEQHQHTNSHHIANEVRHPLPNTFKPFEKSAYKK